ncbi:DUF1345 domain-containing protein [Microlunatus capsulatus]|uniref:Membrane protein n=1 Tax=Microlunatus capsulatus TaxID=99117 RepID=A0ABS4ZD45_9ACTN|nr:DUF1345 domain-containing protein [Microlunatus capsulatus]MBP2418951.1 putative membrane protein [Microlunatus capsulatus]
MTRAARTHPRLASDTFRSMLTLGLLLVCSPLIGLLYALTGRSSGTGPDETASVIGSALGCSVFYFAVYQLLTWRVFGRAGHATLSGWARATTPRSLQQRRLQVWTGSGVRSWAVTAALLALVAVVAVLVNPALRSSALVLTTSLLVVVTSWSMVVYAFAIAYLRLDADEGGLDFPGGDRPVWSDYLYLAVQVSATFSSSDVDVSTAPARKLVTTHTLLAFVFNTIIVALLVSALVTLAG